MFRQSRGLQRRVPNSLRPNPDPYSTMEGDRPYFSPHFRLDRPDFALKAA